MTILVFIIILGLLILVHEMGHFIAAKKAGVRVDEFGFGYPPRAYTIGEKWNTKFTLNWIPFGGFVKIFGENYEKSDNSDINTKYQNSKHKTLSFIEVSKKWQTIILAAGVLFNVIFAFVLFSLGFMIGVPVPEENDFGAKVRNPRLTIVSVLPDSPADIAGLKSGDRILTIESDTEKLNNLSMLEISDFVDQSSGMLEVGVDRGGRTVHLNVLPKVELGSQRKIIGINMDMVGILTLPLPKAILEGARVTIEITTLTAKGIANLLFGIFRGGADLAQVTGPIGIVGLVGDASRLGFAYLITFTALISINLAIVNLIPFPALDGGRILFIVIEFITGRPINQKVAQTLNVIGFALLILLMLVVTYRDIIKLF